MTGPDGMAMLVLSCVVMIGTAGISYLCALVATSRVALASSNASQRFSMILALGKRLEEGRISHDFRLRLDKAISLHSESENATIIVVGGKRGGDRLTEAQAGRDYLLDKGIAPASVILEDKSRHTLENLRETRNILEKMTSTGSDPICPVALVSNRYHLARCGMIADGLGIRHVLCPAESSLLLGVSTVLNLLMEAFFVHWYKVGDFFSTLTNNQRMLGRIR